MTAWQEPGGTGERSADAVGSSGGELRTLPGEDGSVEIDDDPVPRPNDEKYRGCADEGCRACGPAPSRAHLLSHEAESVGVATTAAP